MNIRICKKNEENQIRRIWEYCFSDSPSYVDYYFGKKFFPENVVVLEDEGSLISAIHLNQHRIMLNEKEVDVSYVVGVSTLPEARGKGVMKELMKKSLYEMRRRNQFFSILMPIDFRLYTGFGFANCYDMLTHKLDIFDLKKFKINGDFKSASIKKSNLYNIDNENIELKENIKSVVSDKDEIRTYKDMLDIYRQSQFTNNGYSLRSEKYFSEMIEEADAEGGYIYVNYRDGEPVGYLYYSIENSVMFIREIYYLDITAYKSMLKFVFNHNTQCKKVEIIAGVDNPLRHMLDNPKDAEIEVKPFMMGRILDFETFVNKMEFKNVSATTICFGENVDIEDGVMIEVVDDTIIENTGVYRIYLKDGIVKVEKCGEIREFDDRTFKNTDSISHKDFNSCQLISFTIGELTQIFTGYLSISEVLFMKDLLSDGLYDDSIQNDYIKKLKLILEIEIKNNHINEYV